MGNIGPMAFGPIGEMFQQAVQIGAPQQRGALIGGGMLWVVARDAGHRGERFGTTKV